MLKASRMYPKASTSGDSLPRLEQLRDLHQGPFSFDFFRGQNILIASEGGSQKTGLALWAVTQWNLPTLYFSMDTSAGTMFRRLAACVTGDTTGVVRNGIEWGHLGYYEDAVSKSAGNIHFACPEEPSYKTIMDYVDAWVEAYDAYPEVVVIDNLVDIVPDAGESEWQGYTYILQDLRKLARRSGSVILTLHHMSEAVGSDGSKKKPPARNRLMGKAARIPDAVLSIAKYDDEMLISVAKQREGADDKRCETFIQLKVDAARNRFERWVSLDQQVNPHKWMEENID